MTIADIITLPSEALRKKSKKINIIDGELKSLIKSMEEATLDWEDSREHEVGVALAAVQVNKLLRAMVIRNNFDDKSDRSFKVFINPEITKLEGDIVDDFEGCLSIKDIYGKVPRYSKVRIKAINLKGQEVRVKAEGFLARVFQHEIDHTNGIVFIDHIKDSKEAFYLLTSEGKLDPLDYDKEIKQNSILW